MSGDDDRPFVDWLSLFGISWPVKRVPLWARPLASRAEEVHTTRALRRFLEILRGVDGPVLLDLGLLSGANVSFFGGELAGRIIVHDVVRDLDRAVHDAAPGGVAAAIDRAFTQDPESVDGILAWDVCDYLASTEATRLAELAHRVLKPGGVVFAMFSTLLYEASESTRFTVEDLDHLRYRPQPGALTQHRIWSNREVVRTFSPLRADDTFLLAHGVREVLLRKPRGPGRAP